MANFLGKWKQTKNDNMMAILQAMGVPEDKRASIVDDVVIDISRDGDVYNLHIEGAGMTCINTFKFGEEFQFNTLTGASIKMCLNFENENKIGSTVADDIPIKVTMELKDGELFEHLDLGDCVGTRTYVRA